MFAGDHRPWCTHRGKRKFFLPTLFLLLRQDLLLILLCCVDFCWFSCFYLPYCCRSAGNTTTFGLCQFYIVMLLWQALLPIESHLTSHKSISLLLPFPLPPPLSPSSLCVWGDCIHARTPKRALGGFITLCLIFWFRTRTLSIRLQAIQSHQSSCLYPLCC